MNFSLSQHVTNYLHKTVTTHIFPTLFCQWFFFLTKTDRERERDVWVLKKKIKKKVGAIIASFALICCKMMDS